MLNNRTIWCPVILIDRTRRHGKIFVRRHFLAWQGKEIWCKLHQNNHLPPVIDANIIILTPSNLCKIISRHNFRKLTFWKWWPIEDTRGNNPKTIIHNSAQVEFSNKKIAIFWEWVAIFVRFFDYKIDRIVNIWANIFDLLPIFSF